VGLFRLFVLESVWVHETVTAPVPLYVCPVWDRIRVGWGNYAFD